MASNIHEEIMNELKADYVRFFMTKQGQEWKEFCIETLGGDTCGDFGDYLYDFHPEMLM